MVAAAVNFVVLGTVSALWENPFCIRMTPAGNWEIFTLLLISLLLGLFTGSATRAASIQEDEEGRPAMSSALFTFDVRP